MHHNFMQIEGVANLHLLPPTGALLSIGFAKVRGHPRRGGSILGQVTVFRTDIFTHSLTYLAQVQAVARDLPRGSRLYHHAALAHPHLRQHLISRAISAISRDLDADADLPCTLVFGHPHLDPRADLAPDLRATSLELASGGAAP